MCLCGERNVPYSFYNTFQERRRFRSRNARKKGDVRLNYERSANPDPVILPSNRDSGATVSGIEGNYRVIRLLGRGTMASVYLAEQVSMARPVALKILSPTLAGDPTFVERFLREARASARLNHPNLVAAIDFGEVDSRFFLAMEFVDGMPLSELLARDGFMEEKRVVGIGLQVIAALRHASEHNVIHLDIKPANIMICKDGRVKLADFGLAMILDSPASAEASRKAVGTPYYMAPEQVEGGKLDWRSDQFSLGASLYEAVTGVKPFQGNSVSDILMKRFFEKPEPAWKIGRKKASRAFSAVLAKMLSRSPEGRYQSFADLENDFNRLKDGRKPEVARMTSTASSLPSSSAWDSLGYAKVVERVDSMRRRRRWNWFIYSSLLFLSLLGLYVAMYAKELVGPTPPKIVADDLVMEAEQLPGDVRNVLRPAWEGALAQSMRAETDPTPENLRRAIYSCRLIATNRSYKNTAYAAAALRRIARMEELLVDMGEHAPPQWGVDGEE